MQTHGPAVGLHLQRPATPNGRLQAAVSAQQHLQPGLEFTQIKGLGQIVIGTHVQAQHAVGHAGPGRQNQHGHRIAAGPQSLQNAQAVPPGQLQIEQHRVKPVTSLQAPVGLLAIGGKTHRQPPLPQGRAQPQGDVGGVFDQQDVGVKGIH